MMSSMHLRIHTSEYLKDHGRRPQACLRCTKTRGMRVTSFRRNQHVSTITGGKGQNACASTSPSVICGLQKSERLFVHPRIQCRARYNLSKLTPMPSSGIPKEAASKIPLYTCLENHTLIWHLSLLFYYCR